MLRSSAIIKDLIRHFAVLSLIVATALAGACSSPEKQASYKDCIGNECYDASMYAMCVERIEGEEEAGIIYREVTDTAILRNKEIPVVVYFYVSTATDRAGITAGVEDIAQRLDGRILVVGVDVLQHRQLASDYEVEYVPDFILLKDGEVKERFSAFDRDYWSSTDVYNWLILSNV